MQLRQAAKQLEEKGIGVGLDLGNHSRCPLDSNCPKAVELRRIITEAGVTLEEPTNAPHSADRVIAKIEEHLSYFTQHNPVDAKVRLHFAGQEVDFDISEGATTELNVALRRKLDELKDYKQQIESLSYSLIDTYKTAKIELLRNIQLPQLALDTEIMLRMKIMVTQDNGNAYLIYIPFLFAPEYITTEGVRYELSARDKETLTTPSFLCFKISKEGKFLSVFAYKANGEKLDHYHAINWGDCWGDVHFPPIWDYQLRSIVNLYHQLTGSLGVINGDSLGRHHPEGYPSYTDLFNHSTKLGEEGVIRVRRSTEPATLPPRQAQGGWGIRARPQPINELINVGEDAEGDEED